MDTYFASPERANEKDLKTDIEIVSKNPIIDGILEAVSGLLAVLNEQRQIISLNNALLEMLGIDNAEEVFGLRPGEALKCIYADTTEGGCGTTRYCSTCGAAIAIVSSLSSNKAVERKCVATVKKNGIIADLCLSVRSCPINIDGHRYLLLFIQDITLLEEKASLEHIFYHDILNLITALAGASEMLETAGESEAETYYPFINKVSSRLKNEVIIHRTITSSDMTVYDPLLTKVSLDDVVEEITAFFRYHYTAVDKRLVLPDSLPDMHVITDKPLLLKIITNMLKNAFEATDKGGLVNFGIDKDEDNVVFSVWNNTFIPEELSLRIFQRYFSTKKGFGRGLGTYSMKFLGERILKGKVGFTSSSTLGTSFTYTIRGEPVNSA
jgi:hypothetical protein